MRMKSTRSFMFFLCFTLVLGFLYYSSGRLSLRSTVLKSQAELDSLVDVGFVSSTDLSKSSSNTKTSDVLQSRVPARSVEHVFAAPKAIGLISSKVYDRQGFLRNLDVKLPLELQYKYGNLSKGECKPGYTEAKMTAIYPKFSKPAPMFLDPNFKKFSKITLYPPPFGVRLQEWFIDSILANTRSYTLGPVLDSLSCKRCIIIGNGGILFNKSLGSKIDEYDVVVRLNEAPVRGFEKDVGTKTTMRITYPEGAIQRPERYEKTSLFVLSAFKPMDLRWLRHMMYKERLRSLDGFWKSVARVVPREPMDMRILNPFFIQEASFRLIGLPHNNGLMGRGNIPTLGTVAITMALHNCDEVSVAGFGYDMSAPYAPLHYYERLRMSAIRESWTHNISKEKEFLRKLVKAGVIQDLTHGI